MAGVNIRKVSVDEMVEATQGSEVERVIDLGASCLTIWKHPKIPFFMTVSSCDEQQAIITIEEPSLGLSASG